jgi:ADP-heptose:LPS heptosyltransferase
MLLSRQLGPFKWKESHPPQHAALLRAAGIEAAEVARPYISYSDEDKATITRMLQEHLRAGNERLIVLHPGSDWACQQWLQERWSELADALVTRYGATILFTGSASETAYVEDIQKRMNAPSISLTGKTTLAEMAALLSRSLLCVCADSAIFELTQATNTTAVVLAGPSRPDTGVFGVSAPIVIRRMSEQLARKVSACQDGHNALNEPGCWNYRCSMAGLREISVPTVLHAVEEQLAPDALGTPAEGWIWQAQEKHPYTQCWKRHFRPRKYSLVRVTHETTWRA